MIDADYLDSGFMQSPSTLYGMSSDVGLSNCLQVTRQPPGAYSVRGHFLRVAPTFAWPMVAYLLYATVVALTSWSGRRSQRQLQASEARMRKMLTDLKVHLPFPL